MSVTIINEPFRIRGKNQRLKTMIQEGSNEANVNKLVEILIGDGFDFSLEADTMTPVEDAERIQLPVPFSWPVSTANLKRCLLVSRIPVEGSDKELVLINLHLEAYDSGEGKIAQTRELKGILDEEYEKGNYVIAGGDFNQVFSSRDNDAPPAQPGKWEAGWIDVTAFGGNWQFLMDGDVPSCRSLDQPYEGADPESFQYYLIDGFIVSKNITVTEAAAQDLGFKVSDHNPVLIQVTLE